MKLTNLIDERLNALMARQEEIDPAEIAYEIVMGTEAKYHDAHEAMLQAVTEVVAFRFATAMVLAKATKNPEEFAATMEAIRTMADAFTESVDSPDPIEDDK